MILATYTHTSDKPLDATDLVLYINQGRENDYRTPQVFHGVDQPTVEGVIAAFNENEQYRKLRKNSVAIYHEVLSASPGEDSDFLRNNPDRLEVFMRAYIQMSDPRGEKVCYAKAHLQDTDHAHVHVAWHGCCIRSSKTLRRSKAEFKEHLRNQERTQVAHLPELKHSFVYLTPKRRRELGQEIKGSAASREHRVKVRLRGDQANEPVQNLAWDQLTHKEKAQRLVQQAYKRSLSTTEFHMQLMKQEGIQLNYRSAQVNGIQYLGKKYRWKTLGCEDLVRALENEQLQMQRKVQRDLLESTTPIQSQRKRGLTR